MSQPDGQALRSLLFTPGDQPGKLAKVGSFGADGFVLDLEDAVAETAKDAARGTVAAALPAYPPDPMVLVRVNGVQTGRCEDDVLAVVVERLDGIMVPKVEDAAALHRLDALLTVLERARGLLSGRVRLLPTIETAAGLTACEQIAAAAPARVITLQLGPADLAVDLTVDLTVDARELLYARSRLVAAARAGGLEPAVDGAYFELQNLEGLIADSVHSRELGFQGRCVIYPPHVEPVQQVYGAG